MKKNMGTMDRVIRAIVAVVLIALYFTNVVTGIWGVVLCVLGIALIIASAVGVCPPYMLFGISTCPADKE